MNTLLIVEDEKMIRQGIKSIVMRAPITINQVLDCKNGEEALSILLNQPVDVVITDIRMPKMDGVALIQAMKEHSLSPKVVVISGYDDFNYAVEFLRFGASDYLLKPIEREKIYEVLQRLDQELKVEQDKEDQNHHLLCQQIKYILLQERLEEKDQQELEAKLPVEYYQSGFVICCTNTDGKTESIVNGIIIDEVNEQKVCMITEQDSHLLTDTIFQGKCIGISRPHNDLFELVAAYQEAVEARKQAFICKRSIRFGDALDGEGKSTDINGMDQYIQLIGTGKWDEDNKFIKGIVFKAKQGEISPDELQQRMQYLINQILKVYRGAIDGQEATLSLMQSMYVYDNVDQFCDTVCEWVNTIHRKIMLEFGDYKNKQKIKNAIEFIQKNYKNNLNMAVVSNYISMNYSLFSYTFKQYTGANFAQYLKDIRMEKAKQLLSQTDLKIYEISTEVGYDNEKHFMKLFRATCGVSPSEYRKNALMSR